ncbi:MAG TPA: hypothetical protein VGO11_08310 [Chthoniobacteraceae bacterium]|jgi:hypothetical protein|nr:hypothetical protein [Chthoniobacteraceae bacterium]
MSEEAVRHWRLRLEYLRVEEANCSEVAQKSAIKSGIAEAESKIKQLAPLPARVRDYSRRDPNFEAAIAAVAEAEAKGADPLEGEVVS